MIFFAFFILDSPICVSRKVIYAYVPNETLNITCDVNANPSQVTFKWTNRYGKNLPSNWVYNIINEDNLQSRLEIVTANFSGLFEIDCRPSNLVGESKTPCSKLIYQAGE